MNKNHHRLIIIGSGPAGLAAAIHTSRAQLNPLLISGNSVGGQIIHSRSVTNWPGIQAIPGKELIDTLTEHALSFNTVIINDEVREISLASSPKKLILASGTVLTADAIIITCGGKPKQLECHGAQRYWNNGIYTQIPQKTDLNNKTITIIGGGNSGIGAAKQALARGGAVTLIHHKQTLAANDPAVEFVTNNPNTTLYCGYTPVEVQGTETTPTHLSIMHNETHEIKQIATNILITTIGSRPNSDLFAHQLALSPTGHIVVEAGTTLTAIPGVFAAGDVMDNRYRHAITSTGQGFMAGIDAENYLKTI